MTGEAVAVTCKSHHFGLTSGHGECCFMIKSKPADNLPEDIAGSTCAFSLYFDTSVHGYSDQHVLDCCQHTLFLKSKIFVA